MFHRTTTTSTTTDTSATRRRLLTGVAIAAVGITAGSLTAHAEPGDNGGPGNSGAAKQCQQGGWVDLAPSEAPTDAFVNQDACVSYAANGGVLTAHVLDPSIVVTFAPSGDPSFCAVIGTFDDFAPGDVAVSYSSQQAGVVYPFPNAGAIVTIGADGTAQATFASYVQSSASSTGDAFVQLSTSEASSGFVEVEC